MQVEQLETKEDGFEGWLWKQGERAWMWFCLYGLIMLVQVNGMWWKPGGDQVKYLSMARELAQHGKLLALGQRQLYHAPGYSILISPAFLLPENMWFFGIQLMQWGMLMIVVWASYRWVRWYLPRSVALLIAGIVGINANVWMYVHTPLSEIAFTMFLMLSVLALEQTRRSKDGWKIAGWVCLSAALVGYASLIRQVGVLVAGGYGLVLLRDAIKEKMGWARAIVSTGIVGIVGSAVAVGFVIYDKKMMALSGEEHTYINQVLGNKGVLWQLIDGLHGRVNAVGQLMMPGLFKTYAKGDEWLNPIFLVYVPLTGVMVWGWWKFARRRSDIFAWMMPFYVGLYIVWPYTQDARFFVPILGMFGLCVWEFVKQWKNIRLSIIAIFIGLHLIAAGGRTVNHWKDSAEMNAKWEGYKALVQRMNSDKTGKIGVYPMEREDHDMLMFLSNEQYVEVKGGSEPGEEVTWLLMYEGRKLPRGFETVEVKDGMVLTKSENR